MRPKELIEAIAAETGYTKVQVKAVLEAEAKLQAATLEKGETFNSLLGRFLVTDRAERQGRNPRTGEPMTIPARKLIRFTPKRSRDTGADGSET